MAARKRFAAPKPVEERGPQRLADLLSELMTRRGYGRQLDSRQFQQVWQNVVHPTIARASRPAGLRGGILEIVVANSTVMQELAFQKQSLLSQLQQAIPLAALVDLRLRIGPVE